ncbi:MAG TPA: VWA domain-containing protein [Candidatus Sulfopaludibacter sp.]|nr:VWA domain-containing protein [Candidatus Sulfopaludibacter sp.]
MTQRCLAFLLSGLVVLSQEVPKFKADSTLVLIPVSVTDHSNRFVLGLRPADFQILEDDVPQKVVSLSGEDTPLSIGLLYDRSGSMGAKQQTERQAVTQFLRTMNPPDEAFLVDFADAAELAQGFTTRTDELDLKLAFLQPGGLTALLDAVHLGLRQMKQAKNPRKALLIVSDGGDNHSRYTAKEIQGLVREADVQIFAMGVFEPTLTLGMSTEEVSGPRLLAEIAEQTGGRAFSATEASDLPGVAARIGIELRNQYVLAYQPANQEKDGKYRRVEVRVNPQPGLPPLKAHWRLGYYAPGK